MARYIRHADDRHAAEVAVIVVDSWRRRGLARQLLTALSARARQEGISRFTALIGVDNLAVLELLRNAPADVDLVGYEAGALELRITRRDQLSAAGHR